MELHELQERIQRWKQKNASPEAAAPESVNAGNEYNTAEVLEGDSVDIVADAPEEIYDIPAEIQDDHTGEILAADIEEELTDDDDMFN